MRRRLGGAAALLVGALLLASCAQQGVSTQGQDIHDLYVRIFLLAAPVFVAVEAFLLWCVFRYRKRDDQPAPQDAGSGRVLLVFFAIPTVIIAILFPFGEQTLGDVMHEFYVPALLFMRNALPGHPNDFDFTPTKLGTYPGQCAEFCGLWHSKMTFVLKVVSPAEYSAWIQREKAAALNVSCPPGPPAVQLTAQNTSWNTACIAVKPGTPWSVTVVNKDAGIDHTFGVFDSNKLKVKYFLSPPVAGPSTASFQLVPLKPGRYYFECTIHGPSMSGALIVR